MTLARTSNQLLRSQGNDTTTVAANYPITGDGSTLLPLGLAEDYSGADGESLTFDIADVTDGHRVTISGSQGSSSFDVLNGQDGANGVNGVNGADGQSVAFDITNITNGHRVTLSGVQGSSSFDVMNGDDGVDGVSPTFRFAENADGITVIVSGAQGEDSFTLYNGEGGHTYSAGPNIDITDYTISGKDWTAEIETAISNVSGYYYPMTGNPSGFLTAVDLSNYYQKNETSSREEINAAIAAIPGAVDYSAGSNIDITNHVISGKDWTDTITAASAYAASHAQGTEYTAGANIDITNHVVSGKDWSSHLNSKLDTTTFNTYTASHTADDNTAYTAGANINITNHVISSKNWTNDITAASSYAYSQATADAQGHTYTGVSPIVVNNDEDKISANCIELSAGNGIDSNLLAIGTIAVSGGLGGGVAISGQYKINDSNITADCSAFCMYEQANSPGSYQLIATGNNASWHGYGYTMSKPENLLMDNVSSIAQNYAVSAVSSRVRLMNYPDITFSAVRDTFKAGGIVVPYETTQGYGTFYNFVASAVSASTSSYKFNYIGTNGYATVLTVSSENNGAITGKVKNQSRIFLPPSEAECKVVLVATSGDIPSSGETDGKLYVVTGSGT